MLLRILRLFAAMNPMKMLQGFENLFCSPKMSFWSFYTAW